MQTGRSTTKIQLPSSEAHSAICDLLRVLYSADDEFMSSKHQVLKKILYFFLLKRLGLDYNE